MTATGLLSKLSLLFDIRACPRVLFRNRTLLGQLVRRNLDSRFRGSVLGGVWSFILPLLMLLIYIFVFSIVFKAKFGDLPNDNKLAFALIMFSGMTVFNIFSEGVTTSCSVITGNPNFVKKVIFPLEVLPVAQTLAALIMSVPWLILLVIGILAIGAPFHLGWTAVLLPLTLLPLFGFTSGIAFLVASLSVYLRDLQYVVNVIMQILFFMTPIFYPVEGVPEKFRFILHLNPLTAIVEQTRLLLVYGKIPNWQAVGGSWLIALVVLQLGFVWFVRTKKGFSDVL